MLMYFTGAFCLCLYVYINFSISAARTTVSTPESESVYVDISSASNSSVKFTLTPTLVKDFALELDQSYNVTATPSEPAYHRVRNGSVFGILAKKKRIIQMSNQSY